MTGKYGFDIKENKMRITLLRGSDWPDTKADLGKHKFTYSIYPHKGRWTDAKTVHRGFELNNPLISKVKKTSSGIVKKIDSLFTVSKESVILDSIKPAEDGNGIVLRFYEAHGSRGKIIVNSNFKIESVEECTAMGEQN